MRFIAVVLSLVAIAAFTWISSFPTQAECVASGRVVDPTERHCQTVSGYEQLQEHVWFHATPVLLGAATFWLAAMVAAATISVAG